MHATDLIAAARDGRKISDADLSSFITDIASNSIPDYQASAWLMAVYLRGLSKESLTALTLAMRDSGEILEWKSGSGIVDKHSTGGVGDKISIVLAPLAAAAGLRVPMISGRSLGHTGGTLDKLESIPGMNVRLTLERFRELVENIGFAMCGQTGKIAPADKVLYSLRDATATVSSIPLICASILSKKLAENTDALIFDVKVGSGAFASELSMARELAHTMKSITSATGVKSEYVLTDMNYPLGMKVGNTLEIQECIDVLTGGGPAEIRFLSLKLVAGMIMLAEDSTEDEADIIASLEELLDDGSAFDKFVTMVQAQEGDLDAFERLPAAPVKWEIKTDRSGVWTGVDALVLGEAVRKIGGGRYTIEDVIDPAVGWEQAVNNGTEVKAGDTIGWIYARDEKSVLSVNDELVAAFHWDKPVPQRILEIL